MSDPVTAADLRSYRDAVLVTGQEKSNWIARADAKEIKIAPELVEMQRGRVAVLRELYAYLSAQIKAMEAGDAKNTA